MENRRSTPSWWSRNVRWVVPVLAVVLFVGLILSILMIVFGAIRGSEPVKMAVAQAQAHPEIVDALGEPITLGWFVSGSINVNGPSGDADLAIPISGPRGSATLYAAAVKSAGRWEFYRLAADVEGRAERINLLE